MLLGPQFQPEAQYCFSQIWESLLSLNHTVNVAVFNFISHKPRQNWTPGLLSFDTLNGCFTTCITFLGMHHVPVLLSQCFISTLACFPILPPPFTNIQLQVHIPQCPMSGALVFCFGKFSHTEAHHTRAWITTKQGKKLSRVCIHSMANRAGLHLSWLWYYSSILSKMLMMKVVMAPVTELQKSSPCDYGTMV